MDLIPGNSHTDTVDNTVTHNAGVNATQDEKPFQITGSYGPSSPEVTSIREAHELHGQPIALYELMQGLVDYGKGYNPPPRVIIEYANGEKHIFHGMPILQGTSPITAISFVNAGSGMSPEDMIINRHGGGEGTLGMRGKGLKLATSYLLEKGMRVKVSSHYEGRPWEGNITLRPTESNVTTVLHLDGKWKKSESAQHITNIRIEQPSDQFIQELCNTPDFFLYANPNYFNPIIVPRSENPWPHLTSEIDTGTVSLLKKPRESQYQNYIYVDGLRVPIHGERAIFCWSFSNLSRPENHRHKVKRSHDSTSAEYWNLGELVQEVLYYTDDEALLEEYITTGIEASNMSLAGGGHWDTIECKSISSYHIMGLRTIELVQKIWKQHYGDATIDNDHDFIQKQEGSKETGETIRVIYAAPGLYEFLRKAGISDYKKALRIQNTRALNHIAPLHVPSAKEQTALIEFSERVANAKGSIEVDYFNKKRCLHITLPDLVTHERQLSGQSEKPWGMIIRIAAIIATVENIDCKVFALSNGEVHEIQIQNWTHNFNDPDWYHSKIDIVTYKLSDRPELKEFTEDATHIILQGDAITAAIPSKMDVAIEHFNRYIEAIAARVSKLPLKKLTNRLSRKTDTPRRIKKTWSRTGVGNQKKNDLFNKPEDDAFSSEKASESGSFTHGYYQEGYGTMLEHIAATKSMEWTNIEKWQQEAVPQKTPRRFANKLVQPGFEGETNLPVKTGEVIIGYNAPKGAEITFFRDTRTGIYKATSKGEGFTYYTAPSTNFEYALKEPIPDEKESFLILENLKEPWKSFIEEVKKDPKLSTHEKAQKAQSLWTAHFVYSANPDLNKAFEGESLGEISTNIVNTCRGICNVSATGFAMLLRAINIPSRVVYGHVIQPSGGGPHMWTEYWNGSRWLPIESQIGIKVDMPYPVAQKRYQHNRNSNSHQNRPKNPLTRKLGWIIAGLIAAGAAAKPFFPSENPALTEKGPAPKPIPEGLEISSETPDEICFKVNKSIKRVYDKF